MGEAEGNNGLLDFGNLSCCQVGFTITQSQRRAHIIGNYDLGKYNFILYPLFLIYHQSLWFQ